MDLQNDTVLPSDFSVAHFERWVNTFLPNKNKLDQNRLDQNELEQNKLAHNVPNEKASVEANFDTKKQLESVRQLLASCESNANSKTIASPLEPWNNYKELTSRVFQTADILLELNADIDTICACLLHPFVEQKFLSLEKVQENSTAIVYGRVKGLMVMAHIRELQRNLSGHAKPKGESKGETIDQVKQQRQNDQSQVNNLRKMLLVMVDDVKVVLIKLAERLCILRNAKHYTEDYQQQVALEVQDIYAPLANRLGVGALKWEMEDLAFRYLNRQTYADIAKQLAEKRGQRESYVADVLVKIDTALQEMNIKAELMGRAKHIFSIWKKMQRKQVGFEEIYDVRAVRILVPKIHDCYSVLGIVHGLWKHIPKEFDDYIATPKENGYSSLHTAVIGPDGKTLEVQIRTHKMHQESELGVAAHWKYKEGSSAPAGGFEAKIAWLRQLLEWQGEMNDGQQLAEDFKNQVFEERVYVFTPQGKLIDLPAGSTALDFAYRVHTDVGHRCRGAKANGRIIPLTEPLITGQKIEILTSKTGGPSRDWLSEQRGYLRSPQAKSKIQQWFKHQDKDKNIAAGKQMLDQEIKKHGLQPVDWEWLAKQFNYNKSEELYAGIGATDKGINTVLNAVKKMQTAEESFNRETVVKKAPKIERRSNSSDILVEGVGNLLTRMAGCCKPIPGDEISGYVTLNRGIMIHRADCRLLLNLHEKSPEKILQVDWTEQVNKRYIIDLKIKAYDRKGLLSDITAQLASEKVSVTRLNTLVNPKKLDLTIDIQIEVTNLANVSRIINLIEQLPNIVSVRRNG